MALASAARVTKAIGLVALLASCSTLVQAPRTGGVIDCTDSYVMPSLDAAAWAATVAGTVYLVATKDDCSALDCLVIPGAVVTDIILPLVAAHGFYKVSECRRARREASAPAEPPAPRWPTLP